MPDVSPATGTLSVRRLPGTIVAKHRTNVDRLVSSPAKARGTLNTEDCLIVLSSISGEGRLCRRKRNLEEEIWPAFGRNESRGAT